jgi:hypothetical protein
LPVSAPEEEKKSEQSQELEEKNDQWVQDFEDEKHKSEEEDGHFPHFDDKSNTIEKPDSPKPI